MTTPFIQSNSVVFELHSGQLHVGDLRNIAAVYDVALSGLCHVPASAIHRARDAHDGAFSIDNAQIFLIDAKYYELIQHEIVSRGPIVPNRQLFQELRTKYKTAFGYVVSGDLYDAQFDGDGTYCLDLGLIRSGLPPRTDNHLIDATELLRRVISGMNTLVCAKCFSAELQNLPELEMSRFEAGPEKDWCLAMAEYALAQGWTATPEQGAFGDITPICPTCRAAKG